MFTIIMRAPMRACIGAVSLALILLLAGASGLFGQAANAASTCQTQPLGVASDFNLFILGDMTQSGSDTEGRVAVGGNANLSSYDIGLKLGNSNGTRDDLIVGGNVVYNNGQVNNGNAVYGGTGSFNGVTFLHGSARKGSVINFAAAGTALRNQSSALAALAATGTTTVQWGGITLAGTNSGLNIFTLSGAALNSANNFTINVPSGATVLVNIDGTTDRMAYFGFNLNGATASKTLFNFYQATSLTIGGIGVQGSVFAPRAALTFNWGNINGNTVGASVTSGTLQFNYYPFTGCIPDGGDTSTPTVAPTTTAPSTTIAPTTIAPTTVAATIAPTNTVAPTNTIVPPTNTIVPPTNTVVPPTNTVVPPTNTVVPPTNTVVPPTSTPTNTAVPPTNTVVPPTSTPTNTAVPPTNTAAPPTNTIVPPTSTPTNTAIPTATPKQCYDYNGNPHPC